MASTFECLGFALGGPDDLPPLLDALRPKATFEGRFGGVDIRHWEDPASGARVSFGERDGVLEFLLPSLAAPATVRLAGLEARTAEVFGAAVVDDDGAEAAQLRFELEERHLLRGVEPGVVDAAVVAFGNSIAVTPGAAESLQSVSDSVAAATLGAVVLESATRENSMTGRAFHVVRVRAASCDLALCLAVSEFPESIPVGETLAGSSFVAVSIPSLRESGRVPAATARSAPEQKSEKKRWFRR